jgi:NarL family two-component system response regulator LiaR
MNKIRIIIADDHAIVREGTRIMLEREDDMEVIGEARDGEEAVRLIDVTKQIKAKLPSTAILILTAYQNDEYVFALLEAGAAGYLLKDVPSSEIVEAVRSVYSGESVLHPSIARKVIQRAIVSSAKSTEDKPEVELSEREKEVLMLAAQGLRNKDIADNLCISIRTVQGHINSIFHKLNVGSRTEAIFQSVKKGLISFNDLSES